MKKGQVVLREEKVLASYLPCELCGDIIERANIPYVIRHSTGDDQMKLLQILRRWHRWDPQNLVIAAERISFQLDWK